MQKIDIEIAIECAHLKSTNNFDEEKEYLNLKIDTLAKKAVITAYGWKDESKRNELLNNISFLFTTPLTTRGLGQVFIHIGENSFLQKEDVLTNLEKHTDISDLVFVQHI